MAMDWMEERLLLERPCRRERSQLLVEGELIVPDSKPDMAQLLWGEATPVLEEPRTTETQVRFTGSLKVKLLFRSADGSLCAMQGSLPFTDFVTLDGAADYTTLQLTARTEHLETRRINERKAGIRAVVNVMPQLYGSQSLSVLSGLREGTLETKTRRVKVSGCSLHKTEEIPLTAELSLPSALPPLWEVLDTSLLVAEQECRPMAGRAQLRGLLLLSLLYSGREGTTELFETELPFNGYVEDGSITAETPLFCRMVPGEVSLRVTADEAGEDRRLEVQGKLTACLDILQPTELTCLEDAYHPDLPLVLGHTTLPCPVLAGTACGRTAVKESLPHKEGEILQVLKVWGAMDGEESHAETGRIVTEGSIRVHLLYAAAADEAPVQSAVFLLPFRQELELPAAAEGMAVRTETTLENVSCQLLSPTEVELRASLYTCAMAEEVVPLSFVTSAAEKPEVTPAGPCGNAVLYVVQPGDSLWSIAKKYGTTVRALTRLNDIETPDLIYPRQKLLILRRRR